MEDVSSSANPQPIGVDLSQGVRRSYTKGTFVFRQGDFFDGVYTVISGSVMISKKAPNGKRFNLWSALDSELIGLTSYFNNTDAFSFSAQVISKEAVLAFLDKVTFTRMLNESPSLKTELMRMLCSRITLIENQTHQLLNINSRQRVIDVILSMIKSNRNDESPGAPIIVPYDKSELAIRAGVKPSYLEKLMSELKELRVLHRKQRHIVVDDLASLSKFSTVGL